MDDVGKDEVPMLSVTDRPSDRHENISRRRFSHKNRSVSISIPVSSSESTSSATSFIGFTGPLCSGIKTPEIQMTRGPSYVSLERKDPEQVHIQGDGDNEAKNEHSRASLRPGHHLHNAKGWAGKKLSLLKQCTFGVLNPHAKLVQRGNRFFVISGLLSIFIDPLFFYTLSVKKDQKCILINWPMTKTILVFRSMTDLIYLMHMLVQFRLAFVSPESRVVGAGELVDHPKKIALHYLSGFFFLDLFIVLPLPQIIVLFVLPNAVALTRANYAKNLLRSAILVQYIPRLYRVLFLAFRSPSGFIFESAWVNSGINLLTFVLSGHVVGSCWYLFGLQRVNQCFRDACQLSGIVDCMKFIDCGYGIDFTSFEVEQTWNKWKQNEDSISCFKEDGFPYGIYVKAVDLTTQNSMATRYIYSFFWGFQQICTLAGNLNPSYFFWEVLFTMTLIGLGLLFFAFVFGNMQNFHQGLGRRRLEMLLRRRDVEQWMTRRHLPEDLRRKVQESERYHWATTRGVKEERLMENLPEDLQREIRRHLFKFVKKVRIFALMEEPILDAICEKLRQKTYIKGGTTLYQGGLVTKMVFIVRGKMESMGEDRNKVPLSEGDVCGEELLTWCLEHSYVNGDISDPKKPGYGLLSNRTVQCLTNVEAFVLRAVDLAEVISLFAGSLRNHRIQTAIRYESPYWRSLAAIRIQIAWRYRKKRLCRAEASGSNIILSTSNQLLL